MFLQEQVNVGFQKVPIQLGKTGTPFDTRLSMFPAVPLQNSHGLREAGVLVVADKLRGPWLMSSSTWIDPRLLKNTTGEVIGTSNL